MKTKTATEIYASLEKGIRDIIKAADIYTLHLLSTLRNDSPPPYDTIQSIIKGAVSMVSLSVGPYSEEESALLQKDGHLRAIGQQVIVSSYTAVELYLGHKFQEYYRHLCNEMPSEFVEASLSQISIRSLKDLSKYFYTFFRIHLPSFDIDFSTTEGSSFQPHTAWAALVLLSETRNEILHAGETSYSITTLVDCWYPFQFIQYYVELFGANFDAYIYKGEAYRLVREHNQRVPKNRRKT